MTSQIDPSHPAEGYAYTSNVRANFQVAANEITALQASVTSLQTLLTQAQNDIVNLKARQQIGVNVTSLNPPNTGSSSFVTAGLNLAFSPLNNTRGVIIAVGVMGNTGNGAETDVQVIVGAGAPPANGVAVTATTGTLLGFPVAFLTAKVNDSTPFTLAALATNLIPGNNYWVDLAYRALAGNATLTEVNVTAFELIDPIS